MTHDQTKRSSIYNDRTTRFPLVLMYLAMTLLTVHAQSKTPISAVPSSMSTFSTQNHRITSKIRMIPSYLPTASSPLSSLSTDETRRDYALAARQSDDRTSRTDESVFNYHFLFFALSAVIIAGAVWWAHRRRKRQNAQTRLSGQNALAHDLAGWTNARRFMHGGNRSGQTVSSTRHEEGLDELGEAPPPYQPKTEVDVPARLAEHPNGSITVPSRTLPRDEIERAHPPAYDESFDNLAARPLRPLDT